jgi:two-component system, cell cycle sensor histidine kinase and response regulator CckA
MSPRHLARVLIVDDEPSVLALMARALTEAGYDVLLATNGLEALEFAVCARPRMDAVVTDLRMPQMGGEALAAALHQAEPTLPILFVSGFNESCHADRLEPLLIKPFSPTQLASAVEQLLSRKSAGSRASA